MNTMFCKDCGAVLDPQTNICPVCSASANLAPGQDIASDLSANNYPVSHGQPYDFNRNQSNYYQSELNYIRQNEPTGEFFSGKSAKAKKKNAFKFLKIFCCNYSIHFQYCFYHFFAFKKF